MAKLDAAPKAPQRLLLSGRATKIAQNYGLIGALLLLILFNILFTPNFLTIQTIKINLIQVSTIIIVATGMTLVVATGGIDLSVGSLMAIAGTVAPLIFLNPALQSMNPTGLNVVAILVAILIAGLFGLFNGVLVTAFRIQPIIATLVLFIAGRGIAQVLTNGNLQTFNNPGFQYIGVGQPFGIPLQVILMLIIVAVVAWAMRVTVFGRYVLATGGNEAAARLAGVPVDRIKLAVYGISGLLAGVAGLIAIARNASSDANLVGLGIELDAIAAVAVGGTPLTGGRATVIGTMIGAMMIQLIRFTLLAKGVPEPVARVVTAAIILVSVYMQRQQS